MGIEANKLPWYATGEELQVLLCWPRWGVTSPATVLRRHPILVPMLSISPVLKLHLTLDLLPKNLSLVTVPCNFHLPWSLRVVIVEMLCLGALDCLLTKLKRTPPFQLCIKAYCLDHKVHLKSVHTPALSYVLHYTEHRRMLPTFVVSYRSPCQPLLTQWCGHLGSAHVTWADRSLHIKMMYFPTICLRISVESPRNPTEPRVRDERWDIWRYTKVFLPTKSKCILIILTVTVWDHNAALSKDPKYTELLQKMHLCTKKQVSLP